MTQLPLFSGRADLPELADLGGVLAAHGQITGDATGARLSILLGEPWRADALAQEYGRRGVAVEIRAVDQPDRSADRRILLRSDRRYDLIPLMRQWSRGSVKAMPDRLTVSGHLLRCWVIAAGRRSDTGYELGLDPHAPGMYQQLAQACTRSGWSARPIRVQSGRPVLRITGARRMAALADEIGPPPPGAPPTAFPGPPRPTDKEYVTEQ